MSGDFTQRDTLAAFEKSGRLARLLGTVSSGSIEIRALLTHRGHEMSSYVRYLLDKLAVQFEQAEQAERDADRLMTVQAGSPFLNRPLRTEGEVVRLHRLPKPGPEAA